jgi:hypothetical protein
MSISNIGVNDTTISITHKINTSSAISKKRSIL